VSPTDRGQEPQDPRAARASRVGARRIEIGFQQVSELIHVKGITYVGTIPAECSPILVCRTVSAKAEHRSGRRAPQVPFVARGGVRDHEGGACARGLMASNPVTFGEVEGFIDMLLAACEDKSMNATLEMLLSQPDAKRKAIVHRLLDRLKEKDAPQALIEAMASWTTTPPRRRTR
jgi:hypothetical protein